MMAIHPIPQENIKFEKSKLEETLRRRVYAVHSAIAHGALGAVPVFGYTQNRLTNCEHQYGTELIHFTKGKLFACWVLGNIVYIELMLISNVTAIFILPRFFRRISIAIDHENQQIQLYSIKMQMFYCLISGGERMPLSAMRLEFR